MEEGPQKRPPQAAAASSVRYCPSLLCRCCGAGDSVREFLNGGSQFHLCPSSAYDLGFLVLKRVLSKNGHYGWLDKVFVRKSLMAVGQFRGCHMKHLFRDMNRKSLLLSRYCLEGNSLFPAIFRRFSEPLEANECVNVWTNKQTKSSLPLLGSKTSLFQFCMQIN